MVLTLAGLGCQEATQPNTVELARAPSKGPKIEVTDLGTLGGPYSEAFDINASGQVVGVADTPQGAQHAFLWVNGIMTDLGTLGGEWSVAYGINAAGQVVGESETADHVSHAFVWADGAMKDLGTLAGTMGYSIARDINGAGEIFGWSDASIDGGQHAVVWRKGRIIQLRDFLAGPEGYSGAEAAGLAGRVVGSSYTGQGDHAVLWDKRGIRDLGVLEGGYRSNAFDINPSGQVVGVSNLQDETEHAFLWTNGKMTDLGLLPGDRYLSVAFGISPSGQVVGFSGWYPHAFLWADGIMTALPTLGGRYSSASAINARGQVVGDSDLSDSPPDFIAGHAVLWTIK